MAYLSYNKVNKMINTEHKDLENCESLSNIIMRVNGSDSAAFDARSQTYHNIRAYMNNKRVIAYYCSDNNCAIICIRSERKFFCFTFVNNLYVDGRYCSQGISGESFFKAISDTKRSEKSVICNQEWFNEFQKSLILNNMG